jgi:pimeloyl-ACP methyl ester carboxylesterase
MLTTSSLVELPGRGATRVWEHPGPPGAPTLMLVHGVTLTAALNWSGVLEPLGAKFRVIAMDLCGHGESFGPSGRFSLEECADDLAALARVRGVDEVVAVGYSMGGLIAQLLYHRHRSLVTGLVLCGTARNFRGSRFERMTALMWPAIMATMRWNPLYQAVGAEYLGASLIGHFPDPHTRSWARAQMHRTSLATALSAFRAVSDFTSHDWAAGINVPTAVIVPTRDQVVHPSRQLKLAAAIPGAAVYELDGNHGAFLNAPGTLAGILLTACAWVSAQGSRKRAGPKTSGSGGQSGTRPMAT